MIGIFGGSGLYDPKILEDVKEKEVKTPYGKPSDKIITGSIKGRDVAFLARHGKGHRINPTNIPVRANIWAFKKLGVTQIVSPSAVGSLREEIKPGDLVVTDQFIDRTTKRAQTFYDKEGQVCHISMADPMCEDLRKLIIDSAKGLRIKTHEKGTYVCIEGPRFSTRAESELFRSWGADVVGMTLVPECVLAREAEMCYANVAMSTDFDCWKEEAVDINMVLETMKNNISKFKELLSDVVPKIPEERNCGCKDALKAALL